MKEDTGASIVGAIILISTVVFFYWVHYGFYTAAELAAGQKECESLHEINSGSLFPICVYVYSTTQGRVISIPYEMRNAAQ